jgi:hypothetical protein
MDSSERNVHGRARRIAAQPYNRVQPSRLSVILSLLRSWLHPSLCKDKIPPRHFALAGAYLIKPGRPQTVSA